MSSLGQQASKSVAAETLCINKPQGQVDRDYCLYDAMTCDGQLEVSDETY